MPSAAATSPTASNARSSDTISTTSPGRPAASHTPALTAMRRSLQSFTPAEGALWTSWAPWRASRRAVSWLITRQLPTATNSVRQPARSVARCSISRAMRPGWLVFSTSKKMTRRLDGSAAAGAGGSMRAAKAGSGVASGTTGSCSTRDGSGSGAGSTSGAGLVVAAPRRRNRPALVRSMSCIIRAHTAAG